MLALRVSHLFAMPLSDVLEMDMAELAIFAAYVAQRDEIENDKFRFLAAQILNAAFGNEKVWTIDDFKAPPESQSGPITDQQAMKVLAIWSAACQPPPEATPEAGRPGSKR